MPYADARAEALALLRSWARHQVATGVSLRRIDRDLRVAVHSILQEFRTVNDVPGVRYWHISPDEIFVTTMIGEPPPLPPTDDHVVFEVERWFWLGKQHLTNPEDDL